jgi:hypothetical protein
MWRALLAMALFAVPPRAGAQEVTFGNDLTLPANVPFDCSVWPIPGGFVPTGQGTCTWSSSLSPTHGLFVPSGNGTVTQVRVKVGATTGPMQVIVFQGLRDGNTNNVGCCQQVGQSDVFTPQANAITALPVSLAVRADITPDENNIYAFDILGLSILQAGVPIPAFDTGNHSPSGPNDLIDFPASQPGASISPDDAFGYELLIQADWTAGGGGGGGAGGGPPTQSGPPIAFASPTALVQRNRALIDLTCALAGPCPGRLRLQDGAAPGATVLAISRATVELRAKKPRTYAAGHFDVPAGATAMVAAKLKPAGRKLTRLNPSVQVWANVTLTSGGKTTTVSRQITLTH